MCESADWFVAAAAAVKGLTGGAAGGCNVSAVVQYTVKSAPQGRLSCHLVIEQGEVMTLASGPATTKSDIAITIDYDDALAIVNGTVAPEVAYMNGAMRLEGRYAVWLTDLRELRASMIAVLSSLQNQISD